MAGAESWDLKLHCMGGKLVQKFRVRKMLEWWPHYGHTKDLHPHRLVNKRALRDVNINL